MLDCELENITNSVLLTIFSFAVLIDLSESATDERKPIDIYAIGFEEMVDLDAKNIVNARYAKILQKFQRKH